MALAVTTSRQDRHDTARGAPRARRQPLRPHRTPVARILLAEDEPTTAEVFARALQRDGHEVRLVRDGVQALHALRDDPPDVVVLDLGLPALPGIEVLRWLRAGELRELPVVVVSGVSARALPGADALVQPGVWLEKPLRPRALVEVVRELRGRA